MKKVLLTLIFIALEIGVFCQTQIDLNVQSSNSAQNADNQLNEVVKKIQTEYKSDTLFINNLKVSQTIWEKFREAELDLKFPDYQNYYGSILPMCKNEFYTELTNDRIQTLKTWLEGIPEGDGCAGSVRTAQ